MISQFSWLTFSCAYLMLKIDLNMPILGVHFGWSFEKGCSLQGVKVLLQHLAAAGCENVSGNQALKGSSFSLSGRVG